MIQAFRRHVRRSVRSMVAAAVLVAAAAVAAVGIQSPAAASFTPMQRCQDGADANSYSLVEVNYDPGRYLDWTTPLLRHGDVYKVVWYSGTINDGGWPTSTNWSPDGAGWGQLAPSGGSWPQPGVPKYGLIAAWRGLLGYYWLGANSPCVQWTGGDGGQAAFYMNDEFPAGNSGHWTLTLKLFRV